jgi:hypothetical protein
MYSTFNELSEESILLANALIELFELIKALHNDLPTNPLAPVMQIFFIYF